MENSYTSYGNDGNHFNQSINAGNNSTVPDEIADALKEFVSRMGERKQACAEAANTPRHPKHIDQANVFESSTIKYCMLNTTPFFKRLVKMGNKFF